MWHTPLKWKQTWENKHLGLRLSIWQVYLKFCFKYEYKCQPKLRVGFYLYSLIQQTCTRHLLKCEGHENESNIIPFKYLQCRCIVENRKEKKWTAGIVLSEVCSGSCGTKEVLQKASENSSQNRRVLSLTLRNNREKDCRENDVSRKVCRLKWLQENSRGLEWLGERLEAQIIKQKMSHLSHNWQTGSTSKPGQPEAEVYFLQGHSDSHMWRIWGESQKWGRQDH